MAMDPRDRLFGPVAFLSGADNTVRVDFGDLVRKLVLSEEIVLESSRLAEFPPLIQKFGYDGIKELLDSKRFRVHCDPVFIAQTGQMTILASRVRKGLLPLGSYSFQVMRSRQWRNDIHSNLLAINRAPGLKGKQPDTLRNLVAAALLDRAEDAGERARAQLAQDLETNNSILRTSVALAVRKLFNRDIAVGGFHLRAEHIDETDWRVETNLGERLGLDVAETHQAVAHGLVGVGNLNQRIECMERYRALTGFRSDELPLVEEKLSFLARQLDPDVQNERFERVIELTGLPDVNSDPEVHDADMGRLLEVAADEEAQAFRRWLRGVDELDDEAVRAEIHKIRDVVARAVRSGPGKGVRFLATTGLGLVEPVSGTVSGALDAFLLERVVPEPGPTAFLSRLYPSVFR